MGMGEGGGGYSVILRGKTNSNNALNVFELNQ